MFLKVWAYEAVDRIGEDFGYRSASNGDAIPRLLRWHNTGHAKLIKNADLEELIAENQVMLYKFMRFVI